MKKLGLIGGVVIAAVVVIAVLVAGSMGETSDIYASGRVVLDPKLKDAAKGIRTLFIIASGPDRPMPLGAQRTTLTGDADGVVYTFTLTKDNFQTMGGGAAMAAGGNALPAKFRLKARLDQDGAAGPDQPGDLVGDVKEVTLGAKGVEIVIDRRVE